MEGAAAEMEKAIESGSFRCHAPIVAGALRLSVMVNFHFLTALVRIYGYHHLKSFQLALEG